jgi:hypothetical protein
MKHYAKQFDFMRKMVDMPKENLEDNREDREPAFSSTDKIWFGKYGPKGLNETLQDIPSSYLWWLWYEAGYRTFSGVAINPNAQISQELWNKVKLANYIWNNRSDIEQRMGDELK